MSARNRIYIMIAVFVVCLPGRLEAGASGIFSRAVNWWQAHSVSIAPSLSEEAPQGDEGAIGGGRPPSRAPGMCVVPREPPRTDCQIGSGFLCVATPDGGYASDSFRLRGTIDRQGSVPASIRVAVQNEYTNRMTLVDTSQPQDGDCWGLSPPSVPFCLARDGKFSVLVPLSSQGPHSISMSATRLTGASEEARLRTARVIPLNLSADKLTFTPDVRTKPETDAQTVMVTASLLGDCRFCDFIGASTGGVRFEIENAINSADGSVRRITCATTVEQGGQGRFTVGIPAGAGANTLTIRACNAASAGGACPTVQNITFAGKGDTAGFNIISPPPAPAYDSDEYPSINWEFSLGNNSACVNMQFNREPAREICPNTSGKHTAELNPKVGINVATIAREGADEFGWTFGWGKIESPYANGEGEMEIPGALQAAIPKKTVNDILLPIVNNFLKSDELHDLIERMLLGDAGDSGAKKEYAPKIAIPKCEESEGSGLKISVEGQPEIETARIENFSFGEDKINLSVLLDGVRIRVNFAMEEGDDPLPLVIAFRRVIADLILEVKEGDDGHTLILLTSPNDDCAFKRGSYCKHTPAALTPARLIGGANSRGHIVECDVDRAPADSKDKCRALNTINEQTGIVNEKVVDAINSAIYCGGSRALTGIARGAKTIHAELGCSGSSPCEGAIKKILPPVDVPVRLNFEDGVDITEDGVLITAGILAGSKETYAATPDRVKIESAGVIVGNETPGRSLSSPTSPGGDLAAALSLDAVNAFLFSAVAQGDGRTKKGLLDFDIHEPFFNSLEFDFVKECDEFIPEPGVRETPPALCQIRPRVGELLGTALTTYGYFPAKKPVMLSLRGNRALSPRISIVTLDDLPIVQRVDSSSGEATTGGEGGTPTDSLAEVQLGGVELSFYALQVDDSVPPDKYGNLAIKQGTNGEPIIESMRPDKGDPRDGPIVSFDLSLLLGIEIGNIEADPEDEDKFFVAVRPLADRSRLVITPVAGGNSTTVPPMGIVSSLAERLNYIISDKSSRGKALRVEIPRKIALDSIGNGDGIFSALGLKTLSFDQDGLALDFDPSLNSIRAVVNAAIKQALHEDGGEVRYRLP